MPEKREYLDGVHLVDSINTNLSKVGLAGFDRGLKFHSLCVQYFLTTKMKYITDVGEESK